MVIMSILRIATKQETYITKPVISKVLPKVSGKIALQGFLASYQSQTTSKSLGHQMGGLAEAILVGLRGEILRH